MPKKLSVGKASTLVELKAELFRKQKDKARGPDAAAASSSLPLYVSSEKPLISKEEAATKAASKEARGRRIQALEAAVIEEERRLQRSKTQLERKAQLYDQLQSGAAPDKDGCLVNFSMARSVREREVEDREERAADEEVLDGDWVEFTDFFGRQRRCRKEELADFLRRDDEAASAQAAEEDGGGRSEEAEASSSKAHYQSVLGGEAREHGVAYYAFSKDEGERAEEMGRLDAMRAATEAARSRSEQIRAKRQAQMAERLDKVRQRKRLREEEVDEAVVEEPRQETLEEKLQKELREAEERVQERKRDTHKREWDRGKVLFNQEQWVEEQRKTRPAEFAPPKTY